MLSLALSFLLAAGTPQAERALLPLQTTMKAIQGTRLDLESRGDPRLATAKRQLRDWIESRLTPWNPNWDASALEKQLNEALKAAGLFCETQDPCAKLEPFEGAPGYLERVEVVEQYPALLHVKTRFQIVCGLDESAYVYRWKDGRWQRLWESERNDYAKDRYDPQILHHVLVSGKSEESHLVLTVGRAPWCTSNWRRNFYRLWRVDSSGSRLLLDRSDVGFEDDIKASIRTADLFDQTSADIVTIEFAGHSIDGGVHNREFVRRFEVRGTQVRRIDPLALSPRDFVDEWLTHPRTEAQAWSASNAVRDLMDWHDKLHRDFIFGEFISPTRHCAQPDLWQVGFTTADAKDYYFTVQWRPPYKFAMVTVGDRPSPNCVEADPEADMRGTLFEGTSR